MNKKGFLLGEETLKIVLAVIAIGFLVFFLVSLYYSYSRNKDLEQAEASLEHLIEEINSGSTGIRDVEIYNPEGWHISSWSDPENMPEVCSSVGWDECLCICKHRKIILSQECDEGGICLENDFVIKDKAILAILNAVEIKSPPLILTINYEDKEVTKK